MILLKIVANQTCLQEKARDMVYENIRINQDDGYDITSRNLYCNGCFASGINFAASIISLLYGEEIKTPLYHIVQGL